jgi:hypothetical protein
VPFNGVSPGEGVAFSVPEDYTILPPEFCLLPDTDIWGDKLRKNCGRNRENSEEFQPLARTLAEPASFTVNPDAVLDILHPEQAEDARLRGRRPAIAQTVLASSFNYQWLIFRQSPAKMGHFVSASCQLQPADTS